MKNVGSWLKTLRNAEYEGVRVDYRAALAKQRKQSKTVKKP